MINPDDVQKIHRVINRPPKDDRYAESLKAAKEKKRWTLSYIRTRLFR